jgi:hypothetical protein
MSRIGGEPVPQLSAYNEKTLYQEYLDANNGYCRPDVLPWYWYFPPVVGTNVRLLGYAP